MTISKEILIARKEIGEKIKDARKEKGLTQEELAKMLGYKSKSSINKIEIGERDIPKSLIIKFAKVLNVSPAFLMGWEDDKQEPQKAEIAFALHDGDKGITQEQYAEVTAYEAMVRARIAAQKNIASDKRRDDIHDTVNSMTDEELTELESFLKFKKFQKEHPTE